MVFKKAITTIIISSLAAAAQFSFLFFFLTRDLFPLKTNLKTDLRILGILYLLNIHGVKNMFVEKVPLTCLKFKIIIRIPILKQFGSSFCIFPMSITMYRDQSIYFFESYHSVSDKYAWCQKHVCAADTLNMP